MHMASHDANAMRQGRTVSERRPQHELRGDAQRWFQLALGIVCMAAVANLQYGWTLFVTPLDAETHWGRAAIQQAFTIFIFTSTWVMPLAGYAADRASARFVVMAGGVLAAAA